MARGGKVFRAFGVGQHGVAAATPRVSRSAVDDLLLEAPAEYVRCVVAAIADDRLR